MGALFRLLRRPLKPALGRLQRWPLYRHALRWGLGYVSLEWDVDAFHERDDMIGILPSLRPEIEVAFRVTARWRELRLAQGWLVLLKAPHAPQAWCMGATVAKAARGGGIGQALDHRRFAIAKAHGATEVGGAIAIGNVPAFRMHLASGFRMTKRPFPACFSELAGGNYHMCKPLD